jgi:CarD family transcriptional regulator
MVSDFKVGDFVVYPAHGVGKITEVGAHEICGADVELFVIEFKKDHMILKLPVQRAFSAGLRHICQKDEMADALEILASKSKKKKILWSRRAQEYEAKINSGCISGLADVIRELHVCQLAGEQSYSERQIYQLALDRFVKELAIVENIEEDEAINMVQKVLDVA